MIRVFMATAVACVLATGGAAIAQQATGAAGATGASGQSDGQSDDQAQAHVGAPASAETGIKGVYSLKSMMGLSRGGSSAATAEDSAGDKTGDAGRQDEQPASN